MVVHPRITIIKEEEEDCEGYILKGPKLFFMSS